MEALNFDSIFNIINEILEPKEDESFNTFINDLLISEKEK